ncbi:hypothetical protein ES703_63505 [subsurface metagenome]
MERFLMSQLSSEKDYMFRFRLDDVELEPIYKDSITEKSKNFINKENK